MIKQIVREISDLPALLVPKNEIDPQMNIPRENHIVNRVNEQYRNYCPWCFKLQ